MGNDFRKKITQIHLCMMKKVGIPIDGLGGSDKETAKS